MNTAVTVLLKRYCRAKAKYFSISPEIRHHNMSKLLRCIKMEIVPKRCIRTYMNIKADRYLLMLVLLSAECSVSFLVIPVWNFIMATVCVQEANRKAVLVLLWNMFMTI